jgi:hypothetical protein
MKKYYMLDRKKILEQTNVPGFFKKYYPKDDYFFIIEDRIEIEPETTIVIYHTEEIKKDLDDGTTRVSVDFNTLVKVLTEEELMENYIEYLI